MFSVFTDELLEATGLWSSDEAHRSSTWRELEAVKRVLLSFVERFEFSSVAYR